MHSFHYFIFWKQKLPYYKIKIVCMALLWLFVPILISHFEYVIWWNMMRWYFIYFNSKSVTTWNFHITFIFQIILFKYNGVIFFFCAICLTIHPIIDSLVYQIYSRVFPITYTFSQFFSYPLRQHNIKQLYYIYVVAFSHPPIQLFLYLILSHRFSWFILYSFHFPFT